MLYTRYNVFPFVNTFCMEITCILLTQDRGSPQALASSPIPTLICVIFFMLLYVNKYQFIPNITKPEKLSNFQNGLYLFYLQLYASVLVKFSTRN